MSWAEAVSLMGARGWRLSGKLCPEVEELVAQVEGCWRGTLPEDQFGLVDMEQARQSGGG